MGVVYSNSYDVHWEMAEIAYGILKKGYPNVPITLPFPNWRALFVDLKREMAEVQRQQQLGRLIPQAAFINDYSDKTQPNYDFDLRTSEDDPNHQFDLLKKARRVCYRFRVLFWCSYKIPNTGLNMFAVLAESLVLEWPVDLGGNRFWDKAPLFVNDDSTKKIPSSKSPKKEKEDERKTKRPTFQLRFLALEGLWKMEAHEYIYVEAHLSLHEKFDDNLHQDPSKDDIIGVIMDFKRQPGYEYLFACLPTGGSNPKQLQKTVLGNKVFCGLNDKNGIAINNLEIHYRGEQKALGRNRHFVIRANVMFSTGRGTFQIGSSPNYSPQCFHLFRQNEQYGRLSAGISFYEMKIESLPFVLQKNACKQLFDHYHDVAWKAYNDFLTPGKYKPGKEEKEKSKPKGKKRKSEEETGHSSINLPETYNEAKIPLKAALDWLRGVVPSLNSKWCRNCDLKEMSHLRRLILFQKVCRIAFELKGDWEKSAIQLEKDLFDQVVTKQNERKKQTAWALAMQDKLMDPLSPNAENIVMVEKDDLNAPRYAVGDDFMIVNADGSFGKFIYLSKPAPTLLEWLLEAGRAIEDLNFELGVKEALVGKSMVAMFNEKFITLRSKRRCEKIARDYRYYGSRSPNTHPPAIILCFDDSQSDQILIIYTEMEREKEIHFGSVNLSVIRNTKKMLCKSRKKEIRGFRVYLNEGNLGGYCHIIQIENLNPGKDAFAPHFIYQEDAEEETDCKNWLFKSRPQVILRRNEVNPLFGITQMFKRHRVCNVKPQIENELSRTFMRMDISRDHSGDEPQQDETDDDEIPCKRRNQEIEPESPITQPSSTQALYNSTTESDCETLSNSAAQSRPSSQWNDSEKPGPSRRPWMDLIDEIYLKVKALSDLDPNHLTVSQFADGFMLRHNHQENQNNWQQGERPSRSVTRNRSRTTSSELPSSYSQSSIAQASTSSPSIPSFPQTPDMQGLFDANHFDDDNDDNNDNNPIHLKLQ